MNLGLAAAENRRCGVSEQQRERYCAETIEKTVALRRERDESLEPCLADLDVARRDCEHAAAADEIGFGAIGADGGGIGGELGNTWLLGS